MAAIRVLDSGRVDQRDSAFPQAVQLASGELLCSFSVGGGAHVSGGSCLARSTDGGLHWSDAGTILEADEHGGWANCLRISQTADGARLLAYGFQISNKIENAFGHRPTHAIVCRSEDQGRTWSDAERVPMPADCPLEISHGALALESGKILAPAATLPDEKRLGEEVFLAVSEDQGLSWPRHVRPFYDPQGRYGYFEHKFAEYAPNRLIGVCWTVTLGDYTDQPDSYVLSDDGGETWSPPVSTGIRGQTMTPVPLGDNRLLVLYNRRYGQQAVVGCLVTFDAEGWTVHAEQVVYDAQATHQRPDEIESGIDELNDFAFGFPTAIRLHDGALLATHWSVERGVCGIRWTRLAIDWPV